MLALIGLMACAPAVPAPALTNTLAAPPTPLVLSIDQGERRVRRRAPDPGSSGLTTPFIIKVDRRNGGSPELVMGYEDIAPGQAIVPHRHLLADEIIFVHAGSGVVALGDHQTPFSTGASIYIPRNTRVAVRNTGPVPLSIAFFFSRPGFEELLRESSVPEGDSMIPLSTAERAAIRARNAWHTVYEPQP